MKYELKESTTKVGRGKWIVRDRMTKQVRRYFFDEQKAHKYFASLPNARVIRMKEDAT